MQVFLNDLPVELPDNLTLAQALKHWDTVKGTFAVAMNASFIPSSRYAETQLNEGDCIDIITPMQGG